MNKVGIRLMAIGADFLAALLAWLLFTFLRHQLLGDKVYIFFEPWLSGIVISSFWLLLYAFFGFYKNFLGKSRIREFFNLLKICFFGVVLLMISILGEAVFISNEDPSVYRNSYKHIINYILIHFGLTSVFKLVVLSYSKHLIQKGKIFWKTLVVGSGAAAVDIFNELTKGRVNLGYRFVGYVHVDGSREDSMDDVMPHMGSYRQLEELIRSNGIEQTIIAIEPSEHKKIENILNQVEGLGLRVSIIPDIYQILLGSVKISHVFGTPLIDIKQDLLPVWQQVLKRIFDVMMSASVLLIFSPLYLALMLLVKRSSPGPIFFKQDRVGKDGKPFKIIKFRSMYIDAERFGPALSKENDPRITPLGRIMRKTRLDEIPQFYNVLIGEMSIVGPRPERQYYIDLIVQKAPHYKHLNRVRPGITSLGQVKYGYAENVDEMVRRLKYDILYIENMSLAMDMRILLYTIITVIKGRGK